MSRFILLPLAFVLSFPVALMAFPAAAQVHPAALRLIEEADANADGDISRPEFMAFRAKQFPRLDRNKDGVISTTDIPARLQNRMKDKVENGDVIHGFDLNGDKQVSRQEFELGPTAIFDRIDTDKDAIVTKIEISMAHGSHVGH